MDIKDLEVALIEARAAYYGDGTSALSDAEYDALEEELRALDPSHYLLKLVGSSNTSWTKAKHEMPMGSLDKVQSREEFLAWAQKTAPGGGKVWYATEKLDGMSIELQYLDGKLVKAVTRGDGTVGEDITQNVIKMKGVKQFLSIPFTGSIRGEILLRHSDWKAHMPQLKNPRNGAVGTAKRLNGEGCEHLTVICYSVLNYFFTYPVYDGQLEWLVGQGFLIPSAAGPKTAEEIADVAKGTFDIREELDYDIDGLVIRLNDESAFQDLGSTNMNPKGAIAFKPPPEVKVSMVKEIVWQLGRTGRLTPVAAIEPVVICGSTISRVTLHTAKIAADEGIGVGASVLVSRANDVIPHIDKVLEKAPCPLPTICPACGSVLEADGEYIACVNPTCSAVLPNAISVWVERLGIKQWGPAFIDCLTDTRFAGLVKTLPDIYSLDWDKVAENCGPGIAARAKQELEFNKSIDMATFISGLNIRNCCTTGADLVAAGIDTVEKLLAVTEKELLTIDGIGGTKASSIVKGVAALKDTILALSKVVEIKQKEIVMNSNGTSICFTGAASRPRKELQQLAVAAGFEVKDGVSKGLTYLCMADPASLSSKSVKARKLGTILLSEEDFVKMTEQK